MGKVTLMDCTLRDGGYVNKWNFGNQCIRNIINGLEESNLDIIELGFMRDLEYNKEDSLFLLQGILMNLFLIETARRSMLPLLKWLIIFLLKN